MSTRGSLVLLAPIAPARGGNGLAMRVDMTARAAAADFEVHVVVVPVAGEGPGTGGVPSATVPLPDASRVRRDGPLILAEARWRDRLAAAGAMPRRAALAPVFLADDVVRLLPTGTTVSAVHAVRSYLAPLAVAVAERSGAERSTLDLDDDDEALALATGDLDGAAGWHRLVAAFAPLFTRTALANPDEAAALATRHGIDCDVLPNAVALPHRADRHPRPGHVLFVANFAYPPNRRAAERLVDDVLPALPPRATVTLAGPGGAEAVRPHERVETPGYVPDLGPLYAEAAVVVAPIEEGGGTRIKLLEALAHRVPVVTTPVGAAGLGASDGEHLLLAAEAEGLAAAARRVLADAALADRLAAAGAELVRRGFSEDVVMPRIRAFLRT